MLLRNVKKLNLLSLLLYLIIYINMDYWCKIFLEATIVGISIVVLGFIIKKFCKINDPLMLLFVTGIFNTFNL